MKLNEINIINEKEFQKNHNNITILKEGETFFNNYIKKNDAK